MDPTQKGHQPFVDEETGNVTICNGEIYNYEILKRDFVDTFKFKSHSDCEVLVPMYKEVGIASLCENLDAEFALVIWDNEKKMLVAAVILLVLDHCFMGTPMKARSCLLRRLRF